MNPFSSRSKCAARAALVLAAMSALLIATACGSGSNNGGGGGGGGSFTKASLNGQYVVSLTGIGTDQCGGVSAFSESIVFTADGNGGLSVAVDDFDQCGVSFQLNPAPITGAYSMSKNGTGVLNFNSSTYGITMIDDSHFHVIEGDIFATASGSGEKQDKSSFAAIPTQTFVFQGHNLGISSRAGNMTISGGNIAALEDFLTLGSTLPQSPTALTGSFAPTIDANGRGTFTLSDGSTFAYYMVNAAKFRFMFFSGGSSTLEIGQAEKQAGGPFSAASLGTASYVFGSSGDTITNTVGIHSAGVLTTDGVSALSGTVDWEQDGAVHSGISLQNTSSYSLDSDGRGLLNLDLGNGLSPNQKVFWMVNPTRAYVLVNSSGAIEDGTFTKQQGAPFSNASLTSQSAFVMDGFDVAFKDRSGVITPDGKGNLDWNQQANSFDVNLGGAPSATTNTGTYQVDASGRVTVSVNNVSNSIVFYLSSASSGAMVQEDGADIGGAFEAQATQ